MYWFHYRRAIFFRLFSSLSCSIVAINGKINRQELYLIENDCKRKRNLYRCSWKWLEVVYGKMVQEKSVFMWHYVGWLVPIHWLIRMDGKVHGNFPAHELQDVLLCVSVWILISLNRLIAEIKNKVTLLFGCVCVDFITRHIWLHVQISTIVDVVVRLLDLGVVFYIYMKVHRKQLRRVFDIRVEKKIIPLIIWTEKLCVVCCHWKESPCESTQNQSPIR